MILNRPRSQLQARSDFSLRICNNVLVYRFSNFTLDLMQRLEGMSNEMDFGEGPLSGLPDFKIGMFQKR